MTDGTIGYAVDGHVATVTLRRPRKANAMTTAMARELAAVCARADGDDAVRVVLLTGEGRTFSGGSDVGSLDEYASPWAFRARADYCDAVLGLRKPAIAMLNGAAFGGGLEMALSCDIRIAAKGATFAAPEVRLGWIGGGGASQLLPRICGLGHAALVLLTGTPVSADDALRLGLVQQVVEPEELETATLAVAAEIAANAPVATQAVKAALRASLSTGLDAGMRYEEELVAVCMSSDDRHEGVAAFREKRPPSFRGR